MGPMIFTVVLMLSSSCVISHDDDYNFKSTESDEYYDTSDPEESSSSEALNTIEDDPTTEVTFARYEVTENVVDVPDTSSVHPILANFTLRPPLNTVPPNIINKTDNSRVNPKKNSISILHINAEYEHPESNTEKTNIQDILFFPGIKHYIRGIKKGLFHGIHRFVNRDHDDLNHEGNGANFLANPILFINKIRKNSGSFSKAHKFEESSDEDY